VIGIASNLEILSKDNFPLSNLAPSNYPKIPDGSMLEAKLNQHLYQININQISPGDLLLFNIDNNPRHLAIVSDYKNELGIIHSLAVLRSVVEHRLDEDWKGRICKAYGFSG